MKASFLLPKHAATSTRQRILCADAVVPPIIFASYRFAPGGGTGTFAVPWHFPLPLLPPISRPDASRWVPVNDPEGLAFVA